MPRLPEIFDRDELPEDKRHVYDYLIRARGRVSNGYATLLHSPDLVDRIAHLGTFIRFESSLSKRTVELLALTTAAELGDHYERENHARAAAKVGIAQRVIDAVYNGTSLNDGSEEEMVPIRCARELARGHALSDSSFDAARRLLGERGAVELIGTIAYYAMLAYAHNAMQVRMSAPT
jgi:4-carboxymuconolactone decarboxylase